jgi:hypothetical protein
MILPPRPVISVGGEERRICWNPKPEDNERNEGREKKISSRNAGFWLPAELKRLAPAPDSSQIMYLGAHVNTPERCKVKTITFVIEQTVWPDRVLQIPHPISYI